MRTIVPPPQTVTVLDADTGCPQLPLVEGSGVARAVVWPGVGAFKRSLHRISLATGAKTLPQQHPAEAVYYLIDGTAEVSDLASNERHQLVTGSMIHITPGTPYVFGAGPAGTELVGGPCPADEQLYRHLGR